MGYETTVAGELAFDEPLIFKAFRNSPWRAVNDMRDQHEVHLIEATDVRDTDDGQATVVTATGIEATWETGKHYNLEADLQKLLDCLPYVPVISGYLEITGGEWPAARRVYVQDGRVIGVNPLIVWPLGKLGLPDETVYTRWDSR